MNVRYIALAIALAILAMPLTASAGTWTLDPAGTAFTVAGSGNTNLTTAGNTVTCTGSSGSGSYNAGSGVEGTLALKFTGCLSSNTLCTSVGQSSGTIVTFPGVTFRNVYLDKTANGTATNPGITIKGAEAESTEKFAGFTCGFGLVKIEVFGTVLGEVEEAATKCNTELKKLPLVFESASKGVQKWQKVTTEGTAEDLTARVNGTFETASQDGTGFVETTANVKPTCTT